MTDLSKSILVPTIYSICERVFHCCPSSVSYVNCGVMTFKFSVRIMDGQSYIVRLYPVERSHVVGFEPDLLGRCLTAGLKVPEIIADSRDDHECTLSYIVYREIDGYALSTVSIDLSGETGSRLFNDILDVVNTVGCIPIKGFGELRDAWHASHATLGDFVESSFNDALANATDNLRLVAPDLVSFLRYVGHELTRLLSASSGKLVWADLGPDNILVDTAGRLKGVLDFEGALGGAGFADIGYCYARYAGTQFWETFAQQLERRLDDSARLQINLFAVLRGMRLLRFAGSNLPTGKTRIAVSEVLPGFLKAVKAIKSKRFTEL
jgi:aminoglycoside phosphotransferase (APT) family kinase protein